MTTLMETARIEAPKRSPVGRASPLDPSWDNASLLRRPRPLVRGRVSKTQWDRLAMGRGQPPWEAA
jgi:hypothetical protein